MDHTLQHIQDLLLKTTSFDEDTKQWVFVFTGGVTLRVTSPWRVVANEDIALGWEDDGQQFGLSTPVSAVERLHTLLVDKPIANATVVSRGDLTILVDGGSRLEIFNDSCGYEGWVLWGPGDRQVVAQGGGNVVDSEDDG